MGLTATAAPSSSRLELASAIAAELGCGAALLSSPASVCWAGAIHASGTHLLVSAGEAVAVEPAAKALARALREAGLRPGDAVAIEPAALTLSVAAGLGNRRCPSAEERLAAARARKDTDEISLIERAAELVGAGHAAVRAALSPGVRELDLWTEAQTAMGLLHGAPVEAHVDLMAGARTSEVGLPPSSARTAAGNPVLFDLAPQRDGYWADSCATLACGPPPPSLRQRHDSVRRALDRGLAVAAPGVSGGAVDAAIRAELERDGLSCPHHCGHGVGTAAQEPPWLVPGSDMVLEEGMVVAIEPGAYSDGIGVRLEQLVLIESCGNRALTTHSTELT